MTARYQPFRATSAGGKAWAFSLERRVKYRVMRDLDDAKRMSAFALSCTHTRRSKVPKFLTKFPRTARILVGMSSLLALVVGSGAGIKWGG
jgi:hypothetical protein